MNEPGTTNPNCIKCKLWQNCNSPFMKPVGNKHSVVMFVGDAPNLDDDEAGIPFTGSTKTRLYDILDVLEINDVIFTNTVRCTPSDGKVHKRHIDYCKQFLLDDIQQYNPDIVVLLGNSPLGAILGESGITTWNGVVIEREDRTYIPLLNTAYVERNPAIEDEWLEGFVKISDILAGNYNVSNNIKLHYPKTVVDVQNMITALHTADDVIAFDTETATLDQHSDVAILLACSFAYIDKFDVCHSYGFPIDHSETYFDDDELDIIADLICDFFDTYNGDIEGHNLKFDWKVIKRFFDYEIKSGRDTILMSHMLTSRPDGHGLKRLSGLHLGMYDYDKPLRDYCKTNPECNVYKGGSYAFVPLKLLLPYAALDTAATILLDKVLWEKLSEQQQYFHKELLMRASDAVALMEYNGFALDGFITERYHNIYTHIRDGIYTELNDDVDVKCMVQEKQKLQDYQIIADALDVNVKETGWEKVIKLHEKQKEWGIVNGNIVINKDIIPNKRKKNTRKRQLYTFNPNSDYHVRDLLFVYKGISEDTVEKTDTGLPSVSASSIAVHKEKFPIVDKLRYYKLLNNMLSKYLGPAFHKEWSSDDGRVRSNYNIGKAKTGRVTSSDPNLQNIPTPEKEPGTLLESLPIKNIFTHTFPNGKLMSVDYSGMELRIMACIADVTNMLKAFEDDKDVHSMVGIFATEGTPLQDVTHEQINYFRKHYNHIRYKYKWTNWTLLFGGSEYTLHHLYGIPLDEGKNIIDKYYEAFPEILTFHKWIVDFTMDNGYIESVFGRRLYLPYAKDLRPQVEKQHKKDLRTAYNMPIQSPANDVLFAAEGIIVDRMKKLSMESMLVNTVHDSLVFDVHPDELSELAILTVDAMENVAELAKTYYPNVDFTWLTCPLKADVEVGTHYGAEEHYEVLKV